MFAKAGQTAGPTWLKNNNNATDATYRLHDL